jgi:5-methylcytosine-specific restriction protein B
MLRGFEAMEDGKFNSQHFKLLNKWKGQARDESIPEQNRAYEDLKKAYAATALWGQRLKEELFPQGATEVRQRPTNQANNFLPYNWARVYPTSDAPRVLAYTVGIDATDGFVVKLDLVDSRIEIPGLRARYNAIRGEYHNSPIVATLSPENGLKLSFGELVGWSIDAIRRFKLSYDQVAAQLGLSAGPDQASLLHHFRGHEDFTQRQPGWPHSTTELFSRLARAVNSMGLDWWYTRAIHSQLRFGRRERGAVRGGPVGLLHLRMDGIRIRWSAFASLEALEWTELSTEIVETFEAADKHEGNWPAKLGPRTGRKGYWPDDYEAIEEDEPKSDTPPRNIIYFGPPGTGKTFALQALLARDYNDAEYGRRYELVTFHQSYGYEEFVEGLRPVMSDSGEQRAADNASDSAGGQVRYKINRGAFLRLCDRARENPTQKYAMVIDEINRGNISKIFGELISLVEVDKREGAKNALAVTLPYSNKRFSVPLNVDVIGSMNTADRSLALMDTALRRRFEFIETMPDPSLLNDIVVSHKGVDIDIKRLLTILNQRIEALYDRDHTLGHAFFMRMKDLEVANRFEELKQVFRNKILPLLQEYFFEDWQKIRLVLGDNQKTGREPLQFVQEIGQEEDLLALFGREHELDQYAIRPRYRVNATAFDQPEAYVGIYATNAAGPAA